MPTSPPRPRETRQSGRPPAWRRPPAHGHGGRGGARSVPRGGPSARPRARRRPGRGALPCSAAPAPGPALVLGARGPGGRDRARPGEHDRACAQGRAPRARPGRGGGRLFREGRTCGRRPASARAGLSSQRHPGRRQGQRRPKTRARGAHLVAGRGRGLGPGRGLRGRGAPLPARLGAPAEARRPQHRLGGPLRQGRPRGTPRGRRRRRARLQRDRGRAPGGRRGALRDAGAGGARGWAVPPRGGRVRQVVRPLPAHGPAARRGGGAAGARRTRGQGGL
mmetsp:Transcript_4503/g.14958  ORF Transcript_4503/g.14958 Transcript_4503/m.14958 type:complete len:279 (-) Transcript_4503:351-1187(-)